MGEGEPAPAAPENLGPPEYTIKIFISGNSGSKEITNSQHRIIMILKSLGIKMEAVDISGNTIILIRQKVRWSWSHCFAFICLDTTKTISKVSKLNVFLQPLEWMIREM